MRKFLSSTILATALTWPIAGHAQTTLETVTISSQAGQSPEIEVATDGVMNAPIYIDRQGTAGHQDLSQGVAEPLETWETVARIINVRTDAEGHLDALLVSPEESLGYRLLMLEDVVFVRDTDAPDQVFVLLARTADEFSAMTPFEDATGYTIDDREWANDQMVRSMPYSEGEVLAQDTVGMTLYAGSVEETERGLFDFSNAPDNWTALGEIEDVAQSAGLTDAFILQSGGLFGIGGTEDRIAPENIAFLRNTEGTLYAIYTGPRDAFPDRLETVEP